jgi:membrane protease YdiL (CAAX protease family)
MGEATGLDRTRVTTAGSSFSAAVRHHPVFGFFIFSMAATWLLFVPILLSQRGLGLIQMPDVLGLVLFVLSTYCGPFLAAWIITGIVDGPGGVRAWFGRMIQWRTGIGWYLLVLLAYPLVFAVPALVTGGTTTLMSAGANWRTFIVGYLSAIPVGFFLPTLGEEAGWRGFALTRLQSSHGPMLASLLVGSLHALWHLPAYFVQGAIITGGFDPGVFVGNSLAIMATTFVWTWLFNHAGESILFATFVHATSNAMSGNLPPALGIANPGPWRGLMVIAVVALLVIGLTRGRLGYSKPLTTG